MTLHALENCITELNHLGLGAKFSASQLGLAPNHRPTPDEAGLRCRSKLPPSSQQVCLLRTFETVWMNREVLDHSLTDVQTVSYSKAEIGMSGLE